MAEIESSSRARLWNLIALGTALLIAALLIIVPRLETNRVQSTVSLETLERGESLYIANCATCHGTEGQGWAQEGVLAPAVNGSEHAWHHPDEQLVDLLRNGGVVMPAVGADWSEEEIEAVLSYVKRWWTPRQREAQSGTTGE